MLPSAESTMYLKLQNSLLQLNASRANNLSTTTGPTKPLCTRSLSAVGLSVSIHSHTVSSQVQSDLDNRAAGQIIVGADSHSCSAGCLGALAMGLGSTDTVLALITQRTFLQVSTIQYPAVVAVNLIPYPGARGLVIAVGWDTSARSGRERRHPIHPGSAQTKYSRCRESCRDFRSWLGSPQHRCSIRDMQHDDRVRCTDWRLRT